MPLEAKELALPGGGDFTSSEVRKDAGKLIVVMVRF
jgi:hypothetical protein